MKVSMIILQCTLTIVLQYYLGEALSLNENRDVGKYPMKVNQV